MLGSESEQTQEDLNRSSAQGRGVIPDLIHQISSKITTICRTIINKARRRFY